MVYVSLLKIVPYQKLSILSVKLTHFWIVELTIVEHPTSTRPPFKAAFKDWNFFEDYSMHTHVRAFDNFVPCFDPNEK